MSQTFLQQACNGGIWYDTMRQLLSQRWENTGIEIAAIYDLATTHAGDMRPLDVKLRELGRDGLLYIANNTKSILTKLNDGLPGPITQGTGEPVVAIGDALTTAIQNGASEHLIGEYARYMQAAALSELIFGDKPAELVVSERDTVEQILQSTRTASRPMDLWHTPFEQVWWEFSSCVTIGGVPCRAAVFYASKAKNCTFGALLSKGGLAYRAFSWGETSGARTGCVDAPFQRGIEQAYLDALGTLWDYLTSRNIARSDHKRTSGCVQRIKAKAQPMPEGKKGSTSVARHVIYFHHIEPTGKSSALSGPNNGLAYKVLVPGTFHRWVYCMKCDDVHRHDLLGQPCRRCGVLVGPAENVRVEKYWHCPHYKGPEDGETRESVRVIGRA